MPKWPADFVDTSVETDEGLVKIPSSSKQSSLIFAQLSMDGKNIW